MNLVDVNVLVYAFRRDADRHEQFRDWLSSLLGSDSAFGMSEQILSSVIRVTTHPKVFNQPNTVGEVFEFVDVLRGHPNCRVVTGGQRRWSIFQRLCEAANAKANLITDAWLAALAIESGSIWITTDRDFARFPGLRWQHPLDHSDIVENPG